MRTTRSPTHGEASGRIGAKTALTAAVLVVVSGCASVNFEQSLSQTNEQAAGFTQGQLSLAKTEAERTERMRLATEILGKPLAQADAVRLALVNSPALQALLAQSWADAANTAQKGRIANPVFAFERLRSDGELELVRLLSFGLLDLITLPQRYNVAQRGLAQQRVQLTATVVDQVTQVRLAWVRAVAAQQSLIYARQVNDAADASSDLARRMEATGSFNRLQRARQQVFHADAVAQLAAAQHASLATRESLGRMLGLTDAQAKSLVLPDRFPTLPEVPRSPDQVSAAANQNRLDVQLAQAELNATAKAQGLNQITSLTDIELGVRRDTSFDAEEGDSTTTRGFEASVRLPIFDWGGNLREGMNAQTLAAANRLEATVRAAGSNLRESYSAYRTAFDVARHHRDELVPLRRLIADENVLRYNGMLISVFELLADARDQIGSVGAAIASEEQFWLADAALQASVMGQPTVANVGAMSASGRAAEEH